MIYIVTDVATGERLAEFATGAEAGAYVQSLVKKARITREEAGADDGWRARETSRFSDGTYKLVPWHGAEWVPADHFAHVSCDDPLKIAYTPDAAHGREDRQHRTTPRKYLEKFSSLGASTVTDWCARWASEHGAGRLQFATTPDEIEDVYLNGPNSCMAHSAADYKSDEHPVRVYGAGDLAIAYLRHEDSGADDPLNDDVTARVLCWPDKKIYGRLYGDDTMTLSQLLRDAGYTAADAVSNFDGARLLKIESRGSYICPYLDRPTTEIDVGTDHLIMRCCGALTADSTEGLLEFRERCRNCGANDDDDMEDGLCSDCWYGDNFRCAQCGDGFFRGDYRAIHWRGGEYCEHCATGWLVFCDECGEVTDDPIAAGDHAYCCAECAARDGWHCCVECDEWCRELDDDGHCEDCHEGDTEDCDPEPVPTIDDPRQTCMEF